MALVERSRLMDETTNLKTMQCGMRRHKCKQRKSTGKDDEVEDKVMRFL